MKITAETKVHDLLETYPYLKSWLVSYSAEFKKLENPVLYNTMARVASLETAAAMASKPVDEFVDAVRTQVAQHEIAAEEAAGTGEGAPVSEEIRASRQETLKSIIRKLHDGASVDEVKREFDVLVAEVDSAEIAQMEQALIAEGMAVEEVQRLCDVHVSVFKDSLEDKPDADVADDHPVAAYRRENVAAGEVVAALRCSAETIAGDDVAARSAAMEAIRTDLTRLAEVDTHYLRKENQLFPVLEAHGIEGPTKVMWAIQDDIRGRIKMARALVDGGDGDALSAMLPELLGMVEDMVYKEEKILFPTALQVVTDQEWEAMAAGDPDIGYAWGAGPGGESGAGGPATGETATQPAPSAAGGPMLLPLPTGALSLAQLDLLFRALPFDCTYVDENDTVRFYSEGERVFPRSPAAIGRQVRNCHPPSSVHKVDEILAEFKAGTKDLAEFWIEIGGRFIHIRYYALRDTHGGYKGCLEVVQDATHVRSLSGQRRIVDW